MQKACQCSDSSPCDRFVRRHGCWSYFQRSYRHFVFPLQARYLFLAQASAGLHWFLFLQRYLFRISQVRRSGPLQGAALGYLCGVLWYVGNCSWIYQTMYLYGGMEKPVGISDSYSLRVISWALSRAVCGAADTDQRSLQQHAECAAAGSGPVGCRGACKGASYRISPGTCLEIL